MKSLLIYLSTLTLTAVPAVAQFNSGMPDGFLDRGHMWYESSIDRAALDQLSHYGRLTGGDEQAALLSAVAAARVADPMAMQLLERFEDRYPTSPALPFVWLVKGNCLMDRGDYAGALAVYDRIGDKTLSPSLDAMRLYRMAVAMLETGDARSANRLFGRIDGTAYSDEARFYRGYIAYRDGEYPAARTLLEGVVSNRMPAALAPYYLCQIYYLAGDDDRALTSARRLLSNTGVPASYRAEASRIAGESLYNTRAVDLAIPYLRDYVAGVEGQPLPSAMYILGMSEYGAGNYREAVETLKGPSSLDDAMGQSALLTMGQSYMYLGDMSSAIMALDRAVKLDIDPKVTEEAYYNYCVARGDGGRVPFGSSVAVFEDFLKRYPSSRYASKVSEYLAYGYMNDDNYEAALASINKIANPSERITDARQQILYTLGARDLASGRYRSAIKYLTDARAIGGRDRERVNECELLLGDCYYRLGDYGRAATSYTSYLSKTSADSPNRALAMYDLGYAYFGQKKYGDASARFEQLLRLPSLTVAMKSDATNRIADCRYASKDLAGALRYYDEAARIDPSTADYPMYQRASIQGWQGNPDALIDGMNAMIARFPSSPLVPQALLDIAEAQTSRRLIDEAMITYRRIERDYPSTAQCRQALLLMGSLQSEANRPADAYDTYARLIKGHSPSREATLAARYMQEAAADADRLDDFVAFMRSVPNAPAVDPSEIDRITFTRATNADGWRNYLAKYPNGEYAPQALLLLAQDAASASDHERALEYASRLVTDYPSGELVAGGLKVKGDAEMALGQVPEALESYRALEARASDAGTLNHSRLGQLRASRDLALYDDVVAIADRLLGSSSLGTGQLTEVSFIKATALSNLDRGEEAVAIWTSLADNTADLNGVKSLYYLGQYYYDTDNQARAWECVNRLVDSNTPHSYWLARGYILMSDLYRARGDKFEADEYLKTLRSNYPGTEPDIFNMIDSRL